MKTRPRTAPPFSPGSFPRMTIMIGKSTFAFSRMVFDKLPVSLVTVTVSAVLLIVLFDNGPAVAQPLQPQVLHNFTGQAGPMAPLVEGPDGDLYGVTPSGPGTSWRGQVFKVTPDGVFTTLVAFTGDNGQSPNGLVLGNDGNFYGTTDWGGRYGLGTVFRMTSKGALRTLAYFNNAKGLHPAGRLVQYHDGDFYGTTVTGTNYHGTVFKMTMDGTLTTLLNFPPNYGSNPAAGLTLGRDGTFYGTTGNGLSGIGTVFRVTRRGKLTTLASLKNASSLTLGHGGHFYGTTMEGGNSRAGTVFNVTRHGAVRTLVNFNWTNGALPVGGLTLGPDRNFYGTTMYGGVFEGTVFKVTSDGALTTLAHFTSRPSGVRPYGGVTFGRDGSLYGTTITGGSGDSGIIFRVHLPRAIISQPVSRFKGVGATATFTVGAAGTKPFSYKWLQNGKTMMDGGNVSGANSSTLVLANVGTHDAGDYAAVVANHWGSVTSDVAALTVRKGAHSVVAACQMDVSGPSLEQGDSPASLSAAVPSPHITLTFEGVPNSQYIVQYATNLTISPWFILSTNSASGDGTWTVIEPIGTGEQRFYRASPSVP